MSHVDFKNGQCPLSLSTISMSILKQPNVARRIEGKPHVMSVIFFIMPINAMSHIDFKTCLCRPVDFKGRGPLHTDTKR